MNSLNSIVLDEKMFGIMVKNIESKGHMNFRLPLAIIIDNERFKFNKGELVNGCIELESREGKKIQVVSSDWGKTFDNDKWSPLKPIKLIIRRDWVSKRS